VAVLSAALRDGKARPATVTAQLHISPGMEFLVPSSHHRFTRDLHPIATEASVVYLLRSAKYQFCNCGVLFLHACRSTTCIEYGTTEGNMAKKAKKAKAKKTAKKKKK
jgi:hypothetical protein